MTQSNIGFNRHVKSASIGASNIWFSDKPIGASKLRQSVRLRRRNIGSLWFNRRVKSASIGASPTQEYRLTVVQSARQRCVKGASTTQEYLVLRHINRRVKRCVNRHVSDAGISALRQLNRRVSDATTPPATGLP